MFRLRRTPKEGSLRNRLIGMVMLAVILGLLIHFGFSWLAYTRMADSYWEERLRRQGGFFENIMNWWFEEERKPEDANWWLPEIEPGFAQAFQLVRKDDWTIEYVAAKPRWNNAPSEAPLDPKAFANAARDEGPAYQFCNCGPYRVITIRKDKNIAQFALPQSLGNQVLARFWRDTAASAGVALLVAALLATLASTALIRPLMALSQRARRLEAREPLPGLERRDEVGALARALEDGVSQMRQARERESRFLAAASHELRTPITALVTGLERDLSRKNPEEAKEALKRAHQSALRLSELSANLLTLTRMAQAERPKLEVNLLEVVSQVADELMPLAVDKGLHIEVGGSPVRVMGDPAGLRQLVSNLVGNAVKFTDLGWIGLEVEAKNGCAVLSVEDTGIGLPGTDQTDLKALLEPFRRGGGVAAARPGSGLGLAVVAEVAASHGGTIELQRRGEGGTRAVVQFPLPSVGAL
jgi:signal transduction histidine kinase